MTLFDGQVDKAVKSPLMKEYESIELKLMKELKDAEKAGNKECIRVARLNLSDHVLKKPQYQDNAKKQLSIFDKK